MNGLRACSGDMVLIHDGARPGVSAELLARVLVAAGRVGAATAYIPVTDSIARIAGGRVDETLAREQMGAIQTPQAFSRQLLMTAHERALAEGFEADDDAALVMAMGEPVAAVLGDYRNLKLTRADDMIALRSWLVTPERYQR